MAGQSTPSRAPCARRRWCAVAALALALLYTPIAVAHASPQAAAPTVARAADKGGEGHGHGNKGHGHTNKKGGTNGQDLGAGTGSGDNAAGAGSADTGGGTATPELPSGILMGMALVPAALVLLVRRRRRGGSRGPR